MQDVVKYPVDRFLVDVADLDFIGFTNRLQAILIEVGDGAYKVAFHAFIISIILNVSVYKFLEAFAQEFNNERMINVLDHKPA